MWQNAERAVSYSNNVVTYILEALRGDKSMFKSMTKRSCSDAFQHNCISRYRISPPELFVSGNKMDLAAQRKISTEEGKKLAGRCKHEKKSWPASRDRIYTCQLVFFFSTLCIMFIIAHFWTYAFLCVISIDVCSVTICARRRACSCHHVKVGNSSVPMYFLLTY